MSTKIYEAYRTKPGVELWALVSDLRKQGNASVNACLRKFYNELAAWVDPEKEQYQSAFKQYNDDRAARLVTVWHSLSKAYKAQAGESMRNQFNLDVSLAIRHRLGRFYLIPHCDMTMAKSLDFLKSHPSLNDFSYWNNTDKPGKISESAWEKRGRMWGEMFKSWDNVLVLQFVDPASFYMVDPGMDLIRERLAEVKKAKQPHNVLNKSDKAMSDSVDTQPDKLDKPADSAKTSE